ncbi:MAG TPA: hypothetical protein PKZ05_07935 [Bacteroidales bacterium]|nr:hypothetical protein [Bacteroidales bacterium]HQH15065.1 hypothetical protein [Bacteroidales bacterium]
MPLDNVTYHRTKQIKQRAPLNPKPELLSLPPFSSYLIEIERLW